MNDFDIKALTAAVTKVNGVVVYHKPGHGVIHKIKEIAKENRKEAVEVQFLSDFDLGHIQELYEFLVQHADSVVIFNIHPDAKIPHDLSCVLRGLLDNDEMFFRNYCTDISFKFTGKVIFSVVDDTFRFPDHVINRCFVISV